MNLQDKKETSLAEDIDELSKYIYNDDDDNNQDNKEKFEKNYLNNEDRNNNIEIVTETIDSITFEQLSEKSNNVNNLL